MSLIKTTVVVVNFHSQQMVCRCLASLKQHCPQGIHYLVVDNSLPAEHDLIVAQHSDAEIITTGQNLGFGAGCNLGISRALALKHEFILLINPDAWTDMDFLTQLTAEMRVHPEIGVAGPMILFDDGSERLWNGGGMLNWWAGATRKIVSSSRENKRSIPVDFLSGCAMLLRSEAVRQVGMFAEDYFLYFEDTDLVQRLLSVGWQAAYVPSAVVLHAPSSTTGVHSTNYVYYFSRNRIWFMRRWARWYHYLVFMAFNTLVKLPGAVIIFGILRRRPELVAAYFSGYWDGIKGPPDASGKS